MSSVLLQAFYTSRKVCVMALVLGSQLPCSIDVSLHIVVLFPLLIAHAGTRQNWLLTDEARRDTGIVIGVFLFCMKHETPERFSFNSPLSIAVCAMLPLPVPKTWAPGGREVVKVDNSCKSTKITQTYTTPHCNLHLCLSRHHVASK
jgi:hypothetical protein